MVPPLRVALWLVGIVLIAAGCAAPASDTTDPLPPETGAATIEPVPVAPASTPSPRPEPRSILPAPARSSPPPEPEHAEDGVALTRAALLLPLSGGSAGIGRGLLDAAQLALFDAAPAHFELAPHDTAGTPEGARAAAEAALRSGAQIILGPLFSASVRAVAPSARARDVPIVAFSTDRAVAGDGVYLLGIMPEQQVDRVIAFSASRGLARYAALVPADAYGDTVLRALERATRRHGAVVVQVERYAPRGGAFEEPVLRLAGSERRRVRLDAERRRLTALGDAPSRQAPLRLKGLDTAGGPSFDAVLVPQGGPALRRIAPLLAYHDIDPGEVRFIGTSLWEEPDLGREPSLVGGWFATPPPVQSAAFVARFAEIYGHRPPRIATLAYDAVALAAALAGAPDGPDFSPAAIAQRSGFAGVDGVFRFGPDGVAERGLAVVEVEADGFRVVGPAPRTFERLTN